MKILAGLLAFALAQAAPPRRNLNMETFLCCSGGIRCGLFFEDCCEVNEKKDIGCWMYLWCDKPKSMENCPRVQALLDNFYGY